MLEGYYIERPSGVNPLLKLGAPGLEFETGNNGLWEQLGFASEKSLP
jgi:hypothetical protein